MAETVVEVAAVSKAYRLGRGRYSRLGEVLAGLATRRRSDDQRVLWALRDVTFDVPRGTVLGVIGRNGSGKTTLLRLIARITRPSAGVVRTRGRVGSLLEVGTGMHPELTGAENVVLNGVILGLSRREVRRRFDSIVEFSGVSRFLETPLKHYSSGMYLRLAFSVAAHVEPEILVVDEVLAVGDAEFQQRCVGKMSELGKEGRTVLFISHDLGAIAQLCNRCLWLDHGSIQFDGAAEEAVRRYLDTVLGGHSGAAIEVPLAGGGPVELSFAGIADDGQGAAVIARDRPVRVRFRIMVHEPIRNLDVAFYVINDRGQRILDEAWLDEHRSLDMSELPVEYEAEVTIPPMLVPGRYAVGLWLGTEREDFFNGEVLGLEVAPLPSDRSVALSRRRLVQLPLEWRMRPLGRTQSH